jgi:enamine deaminase RidA (YjgF/YER057c/UK114 family)
MPVDLINSEGLPQSPLYKQVSMATGSTMVFVAGQVSVDADGETVGVGDLATQVEQCYLNVATALASAGATYDDVVKLSIYVVDLASDKMPQFVEGRARAESKLGVALQAPMTGIGVSALAGPDYLVEIEATAVLP